MEAEIQCEKYNLVDPEIVINKEKLIDWVNMCIALSRAPEDLRREVGAWLIVKRLEERIDALNERINEDEEEKDKQAAQRVIDFIGTLDCSKHFEEMYHLFSTIRKHFNLE